MSNIDRANEYDISIATLKVLAETKTNEAPIKFIKDEIPKHVSLSESDWETSESRPTEPKWHQLVRNIQSHHDAPGNFISEGYLAHVDGGLRITDSGIDHLKSLPS